MISFDVKGMSCGHCVKAVTQAILALDAAALVQVDLAHNKVNIDTRQLAPQALEEAITEAGYEVIGRSV
jgi:copper chaperone